MSVKKLRVLLTAVLLGLTALGTSSAQNGSKQNSGSCVCVCVCVCVRMQASSACDDEMPPHFKENLQTIPLPAIAWNKLCYYSLEMTATLFMCTHD